MAEEKQKVVDLKKRVEVIATEKHPFAQKGEKLLVGSLLVDSLVKNGFIEKGK